MKSIISLLTCLLLATLANSQSNPLIIDGKPVSDDQLTAAQLDELYQIRLQNYNLELEFWQTTLFDRHVKSLAKKEAKSEQDIAERLLAVPAPTEREVKEFYQSNQQQITYPFDKIKDDLKSYLLENKKKAAKEKLIASIMKSTKARIALQRPIAPKFNIDIPTSHSQGSPTAKVTIVEFADYRCSHCARAAILMKRVLKTFKTNVYYQFVDFPVFKTLSTEIAEAAYCVGQQDKYWAYHQDLFSQQKALNEIAIEELARVHKVDIDKFSKCRASAKAKDFVAAGKLAGEKLGVTGTPTFFINGSRYSGGLDYQEFAKFLSKFL